jgi:hypothetical protein
MSMSKYASQADYWKDRAMKAEAALFEVVDAVASIDKPWDLIGHGIPARRAEEICELAERGKESLNAAHDEGRKDG